MIHTCNNAFATKGQIESKTHKTHQSSPVALQLDGLVLIPDWNQNQLHEPSWCEQTRNLVCSALCAQETK